jgi:glycosyltransferase involved in cell wall biosynthesis
MVENCTLVVPAYNEADQIHHVLAAFDNWTRKSVVVVDNGSDDSTASVAARFGVVVLHEPRRGKGFAVARAAAWASTDYLFLCDADIRGITESSVADLVATCRDGEVLARLSIRRPAESAAVTLLTAKPLLAALGMDRVLEPIGGLALVSRQFLLNQHLPGGWGFDIALTVASLRSTRRIRELEASGITHRTRALGYYKQMAEDVIRAGLQSAERIPWSHEDCVRCQRA